MENRTRTIVLGVVMGAVTGLIAALLIDRRTSKDGTAGITAGEGLQLGVMVIGLLRAISSLGDKELK